MKLDILWTELETEARQISGNGILTRLLDSEPASTMFAGVQTHSLTRLFLLEAPRNLFPSREQMPELRGFEITVQLIGEEPDTHGTFVLCANDPVFNEVFSVMVTNLYESLKICTDERQIVRIFLEKLRQWQEFFEKNGINGLSEESQRGLYGELYLLKNHILSDPDYYLSGISGWTGSKNRQHDFQFGHIAVEVKTCISKQHQKLVIASEQQLDDTLVANLYLYHLSLSVIQNHVDTLPALVNELRDMLRSVHGAAFDFESTLLERGYLDIHAYRYQTRGYAVREENMFRVSEGFPRLTERDLPAGVGDLTYSISVTECKRFTVPLNEIIAHIHKDK